MYISLDTWQRYLINVQKSKEYWFESKNILGFINNCVFQVVSFRYDLFICTHTASFSIIQGNYVFAGMSFLSEEFAVIQIKMLT